jgi:hypothetical protein
VYPGIGYVAAMSDHAPDPVTPAAAPEEQVVASPPPEPDYSRYRVEPGALIRLADVSTTLSTVNRSPPG